MTLLTYSPTLIVETFSYDVVSSFFDPYFYYSFPISGNSKNSAVISVVLGNKLKIYTGLF